MCANESGLKSDLGLALTRGYLLNAVLLGFSQMENVRIEFSHVEDETAFWTRN